MAANKMHILMVLALAGAFGVLAGGMEFVDDTTPVPAVGSEGGPAFPLSPAELEMWIHGRRVFDRDFHSEDGLGSPDFNGDSCRACHHDPVIGGAAPLDLSVSRFGYDNGGAGPFQNVPGGQVASRLRRVDAQGREEIPANADVFELRQAPSLLGLGLIELVPDNEILANEDRFDANGDGIFGYARFVDVGGGLLEMGRFNWKAGAPTIEDFVRDAYANELGVTVLDDGRGFTLTSDSDGVPDPELPQVDLEDVVFFIRNLAPPPRGGSTSPLLAQGEALFDQIGCVKCHAPTLMSTRGPIHPYSDFLLHNVHPPGFRGMAEVEAPAGFYRTAPLWGCVNTRPYMHDGSAENLVAAIMAHDGEAAQVRQNFQQLSSADRQALMVFLEDL